MCIILTVLQIVIYYVMCLAAGNETIKNWVANHKSGMNTCIDKEKVYESKVPPDSKTS